MKQHFCMAPAELDNLNNQQLRSRFLMDGLFAPDVCTVHYVQEDRLLIFGLMPVRETLTLRCPMFEREAELLSRRELGLVNVGGTAEVLVDGKAWTLKHKDCLYVGMGERAVAVRSLTDEPAKVYAVSCPAHKAYPDGLVDYEGAVKVKLGSREQSNERTIVKYIVPETIPTCQLVMGITTLESGSVWNTMPAHTHERRMEVYMYFEIPENNVVFHMMGEGNETRHIVMQNEQAVISPSWSIHAGAGTSNYTFIWAMGGENQAFDDMDVISTTELR